MQKKPNASDVKAFIDRNTIRTPAAAIRNHYHKQVPHARLAPSRRTKRRLEEEGVAVSRSATMPLKTPMKYDVLQHPVNSPPPYKVLTLSLNPTLKPTLTAAFFYLLFGLLDLGGAR